ncbi:serum basic protease inhibitor-like [Hippopotamus amphibius kiboko]|uniref:serum basic protease inhibitor-like n=1 Tax=Hippopotamus amphibius kiboko TaxID=575201 RepID=UPI00259621D1|nr:serum basic protease inhibitor-like [Hippopotamus amphibius kiboko]
MSRLCLSVALLILVVSLVSCTIGDKGKSHVKGASRPAFCLQPPYTGPCKARKLMYFYNSKSGLCEVFVYGGCLGKSNNFHTAEKCIKTCGGHAGTRRGTVSSAALKL